MNEPKKRTRSRQQIEILSRCTAKRQDRLERVGQLHLSGKSLRAIGEFCGISRAQVCRDLRLVRQEWAQRASQGIHALMERELARLDRIEAEAWRAWENSQQPLVESTVDRTRSGEGVTHRRSKRLRQTAGEQPFLGIMLNCVQARLKLFEMMRIENGNADDMVVEAVEVIVKNRDEAQKMLTFEQFRDAVVKRNDAPQ